jgi:hypothetical protein
MYRVKGQRRALSADGLAAPIADVDRHHTH